MSRHSLFHLDNQASGSLQSQIREMLVEAILSGNLPGGSALPSGRTLAKQLGVGRNTVVLAYQNLVDEGFLISRERSGHYVNSELSQLPQARQRPNSTPPQAQWLDKIRITPSDFPHIYKHRRWRESPYPFVYGQFDPSLFPIADWRECVRESVAISAIHDWAGDRFDRDDADLTHQIRTRLLPRRGIWADEDEILITSGTQQALYLISQLLVGNTSVVGMEEPGYFDARNVLGLDKPEFIPLQIDLKGLILDDQINRCDLIYTTPSHHYPTTVTMPLAHRHKLLQKARDHNVIIVEDDYETENNFFTKKPIPTLKSLDTDKRVLYMGSLSKTLAPGLRLGYLVGPSEFIQQARALRRLIMRHMPANNQQIIALFIKRGHHDSLIHRMHTEFRARWQIMDAALNKHLGSRVRYFSSGGTSFWIRGPQWLNADRLQTTAAKQGVLIESGSVFYITPQQQNNRFRLGFSSISKDRIEPGIEKLAGIIKTLE